MLTPSVIPAGHSGQRRAHWQHKKKVGSDRSDPRRRGTSSLCPRAPGRNLSPLSPTRNRHPIEVRPHNARPSRTSPPPKWQPPLNPTPLRVSQAPQYDRRDPEDRCGHPHGDCLGDPASNGPSYHDSCDFALIPDPRHGHDGAAGSQAAETLVIVCRYAPKSPVEGTETGLRCIITEFPCDCNSDAIRRACF